MIYFLIPVYNESLNIPNLFGEMKNVLPDQEKFFVFSNDGSTDNSIELIKECFKGMSFQVLSDGVNRGPGMAFNIGFEWILTHSKDNKDVVITMEADLTSDISLLPKMFGMQALGFDLVLASVYAQGGGFDKTSFFRKLISAIANLMFRFLLDIKVLTLSSFYRLYGIDLLRKIKSNNETIISEKGFICMIEILIKSINENAAIIEVPMVLHSGKRAGKSKMKIMKTTWEYLKFFAKGRIVKKRNDTDTL